MVLAFSLAACTGALEQEAANKGTLLDSKLASKPSKRSRQARLDQFFKQNGNDGGGQFEGFTRPGNDQQIGGVRRESLVSSDDGEADVNINLVDAPIAAAAKTVLGDILKLNYTIDSRVQGNVTLQTGKAITRDQTVALFEDALAGIGAAIISNEDIYRIMPQAEARKSGGAADFGPGDAAQPGQKPYVVKLRYVSADEIKEVIEPIAPPNMIIRADTARNAIVLFGTSREVAAIKETISVFDVDWMRGMSFALVPVKTSDPQAIVNDLDQIYDTQDGPLRGVVRFVPNKRLRSVLVISSRAKYLKEARQWIRKLDVLADQNEESLHVYQVQNRTASELAKVLSDVLRADRGQSQLSDVEQSEVAPRVAPQIASTTVTEIPVGPETPANGLGSAAEVEAEANAGLPPLPTDSRTRGSKSVVLSSSGNRVKVVSDDSNNSLLIFATESEYGRILQVLQQIDSQPNQVLLEAVIAEVTLDDDLKFGVRWMLGGGESNKGTFSDLADGAITSTFPGFSYFLKANDIGFSLNALSSVTDVRVLSSPSLVVLDNRTAVLQVGDQVPIITQRAQANQGGGAPIINNVELKDTGVILSVTPRVNDSGRVILDITQEVSSVVKTTTSGIDSPTIRQRKIKTAVVVQDGDALALGGLIQERETTGRTKVPVLGDVPIVGNAFRQKSNAIARTELIIFIRPRVIRDMDEAKRITREFRKELGVRAPRVRRKEPTPGSELIRILE